MICIAVVAGSWRKECGVGWKKGEVKGVVTVRFVVERGRRYLCHSIGQPVLYMRGCQKY